LTWDLRGKEGVTGMGAEVIAGGLIAIIFSTCWWLVRSWV